ncbi:MAG: hypothetical protein GWO10_11605 [candidate division Zixibacteria bacterium]|nr:hypothetical protein [Phycisphaerae bacterium]NIR64384.1 hypothetical protein [candidate division Zixibacteria bacterium]NIP53575.1 hypothetical protein [Phycisphaerae bacterium]NIS52533.1 hypothetical protein [Phycisphaerae bacterium]NIW95198.1 hypothetical protein [Phycisphaerae bacterium]
MRRVIFAIIIIALLMEAMAFASQWQSINIGDCCDGNFEYDSGIDAWVVKNNGGWLWNRKDSFYYLCDKLHGDGEVTACIVGINSILPNTGNRQTKVGIMIRETLKTGSKHSMTALSPSPQNGHKIIFEYRAIADDDTHQSFNGSLEAVEQDMFFSFPFWIKLQRKGGQFRGYFSYDSVRWFQTGDAQIIDMADTVYAGLAVIANPSGTAGIVELNDMTVRHWIEGIPDAEIEADPKKAAKEAYGILLGLGNWNANRAVVETHGNLIAKCLLVIAMAREIEGSSDSRILREYYRILEMFPDSTAAAKALSRIVLLDRKKGLDYARKWLRREMPRQRLEDFCLYLSKEYATKGNQQRDDSLGLLLETCVVLLDKPQFLYKLVNTLMLSKASDSLYRHLIRSCMAKAPKQGRASAIMRYLNLIGTREQKQQIVQHIALWAAMEYQGTALAICARTTLADSEYLKNNNYVLALKVFAPELFGQDRPEPKIVKSLEEAIAGYRANTLLPGGLDMENLYRAVADFAIDVRLNAVAVHCQKKVAELRGLKLDIFEQGARKGVKYCNSGPDNEVWFWTGMLAAEDGDMTASTRAYEEFIKREVNSVLAAKAYYEVAKAKMMLGQDAKEILAKAKALSPCVPVIELEQKMNATGS